MNTIAIKQKYYGEIEVDQSEKDVVIIVMETKESFAELIAIERENIPALIQSILPENKEVKKAEEILDEEISDNLKNILEQSDTPEDLKSFKRYILDAMERYKGQPALPTKEIIVLEVKFFDNDTVMVMNKNGDTYTSNSEELMDFISHTQKNATPTNKQE